MTKRKIQTVLDVLQSHLMTAVLPTLHGGQEVKALAPLILCADGATIEVQAGELHKCVPKYNHGPWEYVEVCASNPPVCGVGQGRVCVPIWHVARYILDHGGFAAQSTPITRTTGPDGEMDYKGTTWRAKLPQQAAAFLRGERPAHVMSVRIEGGASTEPDDAYRVTITVEFSKSSSRYREDICSVTIPLQLWRDVINRC